MRIAAAPQFDPSFWKQPFYLRFAEGDFRFEAVIRNPLHRSVRSVFAESSRARLPRTNPKVRLH